MNIPPPLIWISALAIIFMIVGSYIANRVYKRKQIQEEEQRRIQATPISEATDQVAPSATPAPTPTAPAARWNWAWLWWILIIIAVLWVSRWVWQEIQAPQAPPARSSYAPPPQVRVPERKIFESPLLFARGSKGVSFHNKIVHLDGGRAIFKIHNLPRPMDGAKILVKFFIRRETDGRHRLVVNGRSSFFVRHRGSSLLELVVFDLSNWDTSCFREGKNTFQFSSSGNANVEIHSADIRVE